MFKLYSSIKKLSNIVFPIIFNILLKLRTTLLGININAVLLHKKEQRYLIIAQLPWVVAVGIQLYMVPRDQLVDGLQVDVLHGLMKLIRVLFYQGLQVVLNLVALVVVGDVEERLHWVVQIVLLDQALHHLQIIPFDVVPEGLGVVELGVDALEDQEPLDVVGVDLAGFEESF